MRPLDTYVARIFMYYLTGLFVFTMLTPKHSTLDPRHQIITKGFETFGFRVGLCVWDLKFRA